MKRILALIVFLLFTTGAFGAALTPAVNAPLVSMAGGTAPSTIWVPTATQTINTTAETSCFSATGQGPGQTITGGAPYVGNRFELYCQGVVTTPIGGGSLTIKIKWGSVAVATASGVSLSISLTNQPWALTAYCTMLTISASANSSTMTCNGTLSGASSSPALFSTPATPVSVDTTANQKFDATMTWGSVAGSQSVSALSGHVEILY